MAPIEVFNKLQDTLEEHINQTGQLLDLLEQVENEADREKSAHLWARIERQQEVVDSLWERINEIKLKE